MGAELLVIVDLPETFFDPQHVEDFVNSDAHHRVQSVITKDEKLVCILESFRY